MQGLHVFDPRAGVAVAELRRCVPTDRFSALRWSKPLFAKSEFF